MSSSSASSLSTIEYLVGEAFVIYRVHIIWNRSVFIIVLPVLLLTGTCVTGLVLCQRMAQIETLGLIFGDTLAPWIVSFFVLSLTTNVLTTLLISGRIIWFNYRMRKYNAGYPGVVVAGWGVVELVVQSAAIYTCVLILSLSTYLSGSNIQYIFRDAPQPLIGFVPTLIINRICLRDASRSSPEQMATVRGASASNATSNHGQDRELHPVHPLAINILVSEMHDRSSFERYHGKDGRAQTELSTMESGLELL